LVACQQPKEYVRYITLQEVGKKPEIVNQYALKSMGVDPVDILKRLYSYITIEYIDSVNGFALESTFR
jgi:hypothetical protein